MDGLTVSDALALGNENGGFGGNNIWVIILFFLLAIGNGGLFGGGGEAVATQADIQRGFDTNSIMNKLEGLSDGLCQGFYTQNTATLQGFNGVQSGLNSLGYQLNQCCCETNRNIDSVKAENYRNTCEITNAIHAEGETTRALINQTEMQRLRDELEQAKSVISNAHQTENILNHLGKYYTNPPCYGHNCGYGCGTVVAQ